MIRFLETGAFSDEDEFKKRLLEHPMTKLDPPFTLRPSLVFFPENKARTYFKEQNLALIEENKKNSFSLSGIDEIINSSFLVIDSSAKSSVQVLNPFPPFEKQIMEKRDYCLIGSECGSVSYLSLEFSLEMKKNKPINYYASACIDGPLAFKKSPLVKEILDYWSEKNFIIMNNQIIIDEFPFNLFLEGSIKANEVRNIIYEYHDRLDNHLDNLLPSKLSVAMQNPKKREYYSSLLKKRYPLKLTRENVDDY